MGKQPIIIHADKRRKKEIQHSKKNANPVMDSKRTYCVSVRLNKNELSKLNILRKHYSKAEWLRMASLQNLPPVIPAINTEAWKALTVISQKLNRIATHIDCKSKDSQLTHTELFAVKRQLEDLRQHLLNADIWSKPYEGYAEDQKG
ncbi:hypothetical protein NJ904_000042 [Salmonella enterica]|nr:hypothetical protein [Salmonella enterica subsp. diarizonae]EAY8154863.1 hypothetical protein [Salmonella enterica]EDS4951595.1 hypothetical protein [Salmonella enterica subsp. enterica serovar Redlands]EDX2476064.1 hypothetical protein [Salmonella enterica subsp. diarizonae serovar 16:z10:e,n,x,z15]EBC7338581.1 hypothetical protein [Salmonella enterica]